MFAAMLFAISIVALTQFATFYWRAVLAGAASQPVSESVLESANIEGGRLSAQHFPILLELHALTQDLNPAPSGLRMVKAYFHVVQTAGRTLGRLFPDFAAWSDREGTICARYAAVQIDRRMQANLALAASIRSC
jgi:hypothetical protein